MYTRIVECTVKPDQKDDFRNAIATQVLPLVRNQNGFVELWGLLSDEISDHALVVTLWKSKEDAERFYRQRAPMVDILKPFCAKAPGVEHYYLDTSATHRIALGRAA